MPHNLFLMSIFEIHYIWNTFKLKNHVLKSQNIWHVIRQTLKNNLTNRKFHTKPFNQRWVEKAADSTQSLQAQEHFYNDIDSRSSRAHRHNGTTTEQRVYSRKGRAENWKITRFVHPGQVFQQKITRKISTSSSWLRHWKCANYDEYTNKNYLYT